jgi:hypothetical protein
MVGPERTICVTCWEKNSPTLLHCFACGARLNHEAKELPIGFCPLRYANIRAGVEHSTAGEFVEQNRKVLPKKE